MDTNFQTILDRLLECTITVWIHINSNVFADCTLKKVTEVFDVHVNEYKLPERQLIYICW